MGTFVKILSAVAGAGAALPVISKIAGDKLNGMFIGFALVIVALAMAMGYECVVDAIKGRH